MNPSLLSSPRARFTIVNTLALAGVGLALVSFTGCATSVGASTSEFSGAPRHAAIVVQQAPPASLKESILDRPSPRYVWVTGYWAWKNDKYQWSAGHWELPPPGTDSWVAPRWEKSGEGYTFSEGFWR